MEDAYIVESVSENDGGYLPDSRRIHGVFSSHDLALQYCDKNSSEYTTFEITEYKIDEECS